LNYLVAARSSHRLGEAGKVSEYLGAATDAEPAAADAVQLVEAEIKVQDGQYEQALKVLDGMNSSSRYPRCLEMKRTIYSARRDWASLAGLLPDLRRHKLLSGDGLMELERETYRAWLLDAVGEDEPMDADEARGLWQRLPGDLRKDTELQCAYAGLLMRAGDYPDAEKVILRGLKDQWDSRLVRLYGLLAGESAAAQLTQAESWLTAHSDDPQLLLCLGRLAARDKLWGKARDYFETSYRLQRDPEVCAELGRLLTGLGEPRVAAAYFREGLLLSESKLPDLPEPAKLLPLSQRLARS
jgi:HemY protein